MPRNSRSHRRAPAPNKLIVGRHSKNMSRLKGREGVRWDVTVWQGRGESSATCDVTLVKYFHNTFYRAMHFSAKRGIAIACRLSVCLSVRLSVTLVNCDHIGWNSCECESKKIPPRDLTFFHFFHKRLRICNRFFTHLLNVFIFARLQIFIQLSQILTKLCHIKRDYPVHIICAKCPKNVQNFRRLRKSLIALLIVVCGKWLYLEVKVLVKCKISLGGPA